MSNNNLQPKEQLFNKTKKLISSALIELSFVGTHTNWRDIQYIKKGNDIVQQISTRPDFQKIIPNAEFEGKLFSIKEFADFLRNDESFKKMRQNIIEKTKIEWNWLLPNFIARDILFEYLWLVTSLKYRDDIATLIANNFINFVDNPVSKIAFYCVLRGVYGDIDEIELTDNIIIRKLTYQELNSLIIKNDSLRLKDGIPENLIILEEIFEFEYGRFPSDIFSNLSNKFDLVVDSLRLIKSENVEYENIYWKSVRPGQLGNREIISSGKARPRPPIKLSYKLELSNLDKIRTIYRYLEKKNLSRNHKIAHQRFNEATLRVNNEDKIIDLCIALEALLSDGPGSATYKLGMRVAVLIGKDMTEKHRLVNLVNDAYKFRSAFVHGGNSRKSDKLKLTLSEVTDEFMEVIRRVIITFIDYDIRNHKNISISYIDELLLQ